MNSNIRIDRTAEKNIIKRNSRASEMRLPYFIELLLSLIDSLLSIRISQRAKGIIRVSVSLLCVVCFIGVIGGIEAGSISFAKGIIIGLALTFTEIVALKD